MQKKNMKYRDGWLKKLAFPCIILRRNGQDCSHLSKRIQILWISTQNLNYKNYGLKHLFWYFRKFNFPDHRPSRLYWASSLILFQFYCPAILSIEQYNTIQSTIELSMLNCVTLDLLYLTRNKGFIDDKISQ